jgi:glycosyltransferase involved in cell wall biosynthesis
MTGKALKIGYLWQDQKNDMSEITAGVQHVMAVIGNFQRRGHKVRMVSQREYQYQWSDDLVNWQPAGLRTAQTRSFRHVESAVRSTQNLLQLPYFNFFNSYRFSQACISVLASYDVLYERYWFLNYGGLIAAKHLGIPLVLEMNGDLFEEYHALNIALSRAQWFVIRLINKRLLNGAAHIITVSEPLRKQVISRWHIDPQRVTTVHNGAHVELFAELNDSRNIRSQYELGTEPIIMFVGSFKAWHGLDMLIDAFSIVLSSNPQFKAKLVLVGNGPLRFEIENKVDALGIRGHVAFTGEVPHSEVVSLLRTAQICVMAHPQSPAAMSGSPMKLFEYMAAGKAIVAPALPNIETVLTHCETGFLVPPDNPQAFARALIELLENDSLRISLGQAAQERAFREHSWIQTVSKLESILFELQKKEQH